MLTKICLPGNKTAPFEATLNNCTAVYKAVNRLSGHEYGGGNNNNIIKKANATRSHLFFVYPIPQAAQSPPVSILTSNCFSEWVFLLKLPCLS